MPGPLHHLRGRRGRRQIDPGQAPADQSQPCLDPGGAHARARRHAARPRRSAPSSCRAGRRAGGAGAEAVLFAAARLDHVNQLIAPNLDSRQMGDLRPLPRFHARLSGPHRRGRRQADPRRSRIWRSTATSPTSRSSSTWTPKPPSSAWRSARLEGGAAADRRPLREGRPRLAPPAARRLPRYRREQCRALRRHPRRPERRRAGRGDLGRRDAPFPRTAGREAALERTAENASPTSSTACRCPSTQPAGHRPRARCAPTSPTARQRAACRAASCCTARWASAKRRWRLRLARDILSATGDESPEHIAGAGRGRRAPESLRPAPPAARHGQGLLHRHPRRASPRARASACIRRADGPGIASPSSTRSTTAIPTPPTRC